MFIRPLLKLALPGLLECRAYHSLGWQSLSHFAEVFNASVTETNNDRTLVGYSLGGRLALHALIHSPHLWKQAVIISAHPGLKKEERSARLEADHRWADRFLSEPWEKVLLEWNHQPVFAADPPFLPEERPGDREAIAHALRHGSLGHQEDLRQAIASLPMPILWVTGELDRRFSSLAEELSFSHPDSTRIQIKNRGHRLLFN